MARPPIPPSIRAVVWSRAKGCCAECKAKVLAGQGAIDHRPALIMRGRVPGLPDTDPAAYIPHANDPDFLALVHDKRAGADCHDRRTFGDDDKGGLRRGDLTENARSREITQKQAQFRRDMLAKKGVEPGGTAPEPERNPKRKMQGRSLTDGRVLCHVCGHFGNPSQERCSKCGSANVTPAMALSQSERRKARNA